MLLKLENCSLLNGGLSKSLWPSELLKWLICWTISVIHLCWKTQTFRSWLCVHHQVEICNQLFGSHQMKLVSFPIIKRVPFNWAQDSVYIYNKMKRREIMWGQAWQCVSSFTVGSVNRRKVEQFLFPYSILLNLENRFK